MLKKAALLTMFIISAGCQGADGVSEPPAGAAGSDPAPTAHKNLTQAIDSLSLPPCQFFASDQRQAQSFVTAQALSAAADEAWDVKLERFLINKAKDALSGAVTSIFSDLAEDFLRDFFDIQKDLPSLSQESLERIQAIVHAEVQDALERFSKGEARSEMVTVQNLLREYVTYVHDLGCTDSLLLNDLNVLSETLVNHPIFSPQVTNNYFFMADIYATAASLRIGILTERFSVRMAPDTTLVRQRAAEMHGVLRDMRNQIWGYISYRVRLHEGFGCPGGTLCSYLVQDDLGGQSRSFFRDLNGADAYYQSLVKHYLLELEGAASAETEQRLDDIAKGR